METAVNTLKKKTQVCPYCLQDVPEGSICPCITEGDPDGLTVRDRIMSLQPVNRKRVLHALDVCEACEKNQAKREREAQDVATLTPPPSETSPKASTDNSLSRLNSFALMKYGIQTLEAPCGMIDETIGALIATRERIKEDVGTECLILCVESRLQAAYDALDATRKTVIKEFNKCFPKHEIRP